MPFRETMLHADADLLVADKPRFLAITPVGAHVHETLLGLDVSIQQAGSRSG